MVLLLVVPELLCVLNYHKMCYLFYFVNILIPLELINVIGHSYNSVKSFVMARDEISCTRQCPPFSYGLEWLDMPTSLED